MGGPFDITLHTVSLMDELEAIRQKKMEELKKSRESASYPYKPVTVTDADFNEFVSKHPLVVVDCWAEWCGPCRMVGPIIDALASEYAGKIVFGKLNSDNNRTTMMKYRITGIPTLLVFKNGELVDSIVGAAPKEYLLQRLKPLM
jgi:thioredoxin 1